MIACGHFHSLVIDQEGVVWSAGYNECGQLGLGENEKQHHGFEPVPDLPPIVHASAPNNGYFSVLVDNRGDAWCCGLNDVGQLGLPSQKVCSPMRIPNIPAIVMATCGAQFSVLLDSTGAVWGSGTNKWFPESNAKTETFVRFDTANVGPIVKIRSTLLALIVMSESSKLWGTGFNGNGELGLSHNDEKIASFQEMLIWDDQSNSVQDFSCGATHTLVLDVNGDVWSTGSNWNGQLGHGDYENRNYFAKIENISKMVTISCKVYFSLMIDAGGTVWGCGKNDNRQLGIPHSVHDILSNTVTTPHPIPNLPRIIFGEGGSAHILLCDEEGKLWGCGFNNYGQLGLEMQRTATFTQIPKITINTCRASRFKHTKKALM